MKTFKHILKYGSISGVIMIASWFISHLIFTEDDGSFDMSSGELLGYASMILAFTAVFIGVKNYRDKELKGVINFKKAFAIGLYIVLVTSVIYVIGWMIYYPNFMPDFADQYLDGQITQLEESGLTGVELDQKVEELTSEMELYKNPIVMSGVTFMEIFPVGLVVAFLCALILKKKE
ncbi:MAG: DUF4199 domain-containing protein [Marinoscillum sp.]